MRLTSVKLPRSQSYNNNYGPSLHKSNETGELDHLFSIAMKGMWDSSASKVAT